jgi:FixJ family two-component response regulator
MSTPNPIIRVVDDDASFRAALTRLLNAAGFTARSYSTASEFLADNRGEPGCVILDVQMPGLSGLDLQQALAAMDEPLPVIFLTGHGSIPMSVQAVKAGAIDFLTKPVLRDTLLPAVRNALDRDASERAARACRRALRARYDLLTPREREVFALVITGKLNKQIGAELGTTERTIKAHRAQILEKLQVQSVAELVRISQTLQMGASPDADR